MNDLQITQVRVCTPQDIDPLCKLAAVDNHAVIAPGYIVEKGQQIIGYVGVIPSLVVWLDSQRAQARDSRYALNVVENLLALQGQALVGLPCEDSSPLRPFLEKIGFVEMKNSSFFVKPLH